MRNSKEWKKQTKTYLIMPLAFILLEITNTNSSAFLGFGNTANWKEEVQLHDGSKIIVERSQKHGGRHEPGQKPGIKEQSIAFTLPGTKQIIKWKDEYSENIMVLQIRKFITRIFNFRIYRKLNPDKPEYRRYISAIDSYPNK